LRGIGQPFLLKTDDGFDEFTRITFSYQAVILKESFLKPGAVPDEKRFLRNDIKKKQQKIRANL